MKRRSSPITQLRPVKIAKIDEDEHVVFGVVYEPNKLDSDGEYMSVEDVKKAAYEFIRKGDRGVIDTQHNNVPVPSTYPVESFIARKGDIDYPENAWVMGVKVNDSEIWEKIKKGELNGFSVEMSVYKIERNIEISTMPVVVGDTESSGDDEHWHTYFVKLNDLGRVIGGITSVNGDAPHRHEIKKASMTEIVNGHSHRFFLPANAQVATI